MGRPFVVLGASTVMVFLLACRSDGAPEPGPLPEELRDATVPLSPFLEGLMKAPPPEWYEAIGERPVEELLGENGCYAVVRVERGFYEAHTFGHYLVVTFVFRDPELEVISKSIDMPEMHILEGVWSLWRGGVKAEHVEAARRNTRALLKTETGTFMPDEVTPKLDLTRALARLGIASLPSVMHSRLDHLFPVVSFVKEVGEKGKVQWSKTFASGGRFGDWPVWRVTAAARWPYGGRPREMSHEFAVIEPFRISDTRYEKILVELAEFSGLLKAEIEKKHKSYAKWVARSAGTTADERPRPSPASPGHDGTGQNVLYISGGGNVHWTVRSPTDQRPAASQAGGNAQEDRPAGNPPAPAR